MKNYARIARVLACCALASTEWALAQSGMASLRVRCDGDSAGAGVSINGQFKGECPFDAMVPEGMLKIEAHKSVGKEYERFFVQEMRVGAGIIKSIEVVLGKEQLTAEAKQAREAQAEAERRAEAEREAQQRREEEARQAEQQRQAAETERQRAAKFERLHNAAQGGDAEAMATLAAAYEKGQNGVTRDHAQAFAWYSKAAEAGNATGMGGLGAMYFNGWGVANDYIEAERWFRKAALAGDARGMFGLYLLHAWGVGVLSRDLEEGIHFLKNSSNANYPFAQLILAQLMMKGEHIPKDAAGGMAMLKALADQQREPEAFTHIGEAYAKGTTGLPQSDSMALHWYSLGAKQGCTGCIVNMGIYHDSGTAGLSKSTVERDKLFRRAADLGTWVAMANLGVTSLPHDRVGALRWFTKAVEADYLWSDKESPRLVYKLQVEENVQPEGGAQGLFCFASMNVLEDPGHKAVMSIVWQNAQPDNGLAAQHVTLAQFINAVRGADTTRWHDFDGSDPVCGAGACYQKVERIFGKSHQASQFCHPVAEHLLRMRARFMRINTETTPWIPPGARQR